MPKVRIENFGCGNVCFGQLNIPGHSIGPKALVVNVEEATVEEFCKLLRRQAPAVATTILLQAEPAAAPEATQDELAEEAEVPEIPEEASEPEPESEPLPVAPDAEEAPKPNAPAFTRGKQRGKKR